MGKLTQKIPKSLTKVAGKPILEYTLSSLPSSIEEVFIVIGRLGNQIKNRFGDKFDKLKINYIELEKLNGTAGALWKAKKFLKRERFLVLNGDDIYYKKELEKMLENNWAFGLAKRIPPRPSYLNIKLNKSGNIAGAGYPTEKEMQGGILIATGAYFLDTNIFRYKPVKIAGGEYGLPQTILKAIKKHPIKAVIMNKWIQINTPEDIKRAEKILNNK